MGECVCGVHARSPLMCVCVCVSVCVCVCVCVMAPARLEELLDALREVGIV